MQCRVPATAQAERAARARIQACDALAGVAFGFAIMAPAWSSRRGPAQPVCSLRGTWAPALLHEALAIKCRAALPVGELTGVFVPFALAQLDVGGNDFIAQALPDHA